MGILNEVLDGQLNEILSRRLNMQGGAPAPGLTPEIFPALILEADRPEWGWLKQEQRFGLQATVLGAASNVSSIRLRNPTGSNILGVVSKIKLVSIEGGAVNVFMSLGNAQLALANGFGTPRDTRWLNAASLAQGRFSMLLASTSATDFSPNGLAVWRFAAADQWDTEIVLAPTGMIDIQSANDDVDMTVCFEWTERRAQPGELV